MALFGKKKEEEKSVKKEDVKEKTSPKSLAVSTKVSDKDLSWVIKKPRITEKGAIAATDAHAYIFNVDPRATKTLIKKAISEIYKVSPIKINVTKIPTKTMFARRKKGTKGGGKKAYVYLKKGESIEFV